MVIYEPPRTFDRGGFCVYTDGGELVYNGAKQLDNIELMPADLMEELAQSGVKYTPEDVLMVTKNSDGDLLWLEKGNEKNGWKHIVDKHGEDFIHSDGSFYSEEEIQALMKNFLDSEPVRTGIKDSGPYAIYSYNGQDYRIGWGDNGYIKSFFPDSKILKKRGN